jgi:hypothetical protein
MPPNPANNDDARRQLNVSWRLRHGDSADLTSTGTNSLLLSSPSKFCHLGLEALDILGCVGSSSPWQRERKVSIEEERSNHADRLSSLRSARPGAQGAPVSAWLQ